MKPIADTLCYAMGRVCHRLRARAASALLAEGVHIGQEMVLLNLWEADGLTPSDLARRLGNELPTVTRMLDRMAEAGLVRRQGSPADARSSVVFLTAEGRQAHARVEAAWNTLNDSVFRGLTATEEAALKGLLGKVYANLSDRAGER